LVSRHVGTIGLKRTRIPLRKKQRAIPSKKIFRGGVGQPVFVIRKGKNARRKRR
jgi:hypothetical protein